MKKKQAIVHSILAIGIFCLIACGGGGGGGTPIIEPTGLTYTGVTSQAIIDSSNAVGLAGDAFLGGESATDLSIFNSLSGPAPLFSREITLYEIVKIFESEIYKIDFDAQRMDSLAIQSEQQTEYGDCGGSVIFAAEMDDVTGNFTGSMSFDGFCNGGTTISGTVGLSGQLDVNTSDFLHFNMSLNMVSLVSDNQSYVMDGGVSFNVTGATSTASIGMMMRDHSGEVFWVKDYVLTTTEGVDYVSINMNGRFYHPTHGYVDLSTITEARIYKAYEWPSSGEFQIFGADNTKARLTAIDENNCEIVADTNGDDTYDYGPVTMSWSDI
jgi:hypothetical protein